MTIASEETANIPKYTPPVEPMMAQPCWCGSETCRTVSHKDRWGQPLTTVMCLQCGTIRQEPRMSTEQAAEFYADEYEKTYEAMAFFERQSALQAHLYLRPFLGDVKNVLDYGCGPGGKLAALAGREIDVYGFDLNPHFLAFAETKGLKRYEPAARYDCIFLSHTLEHWVHPRDDLAALLARNLKPGGRVIIEVPLVDRLCLGDRRGGFAEETHLAHIWYFSTATLSALMATMACELTFSDKVTTCVFQHRPAGGPMRAISRPTVERMRLALIELNKNRLCARITCRLNRSLRFVDTGFQERTITAQRHGR